MGERTKSTSTKKKKPPKKKFLESEDKFVMKCSRRKLTVALKLLEQKMQTNKVRLEALKIKEKCKSIPERISGSYRCTNFLPCSTAYKSVQLRNALISHNWKDASLLLLNILKDPISQMFYRNIWKAFFIILQHSPHANYTRMEQFRELCNKLSGKDNFLDSLYFQPYVLHSGSVCDSNEPPTKMESFQA